MVIRESSNSEYTSADDELSDWGKDDLNYVNQLVKSKDKVDKRLVDIHMLKRSHQR